jgi:hypothetical protein
MRSYPVRDRLTALAALLTILISGSLSPRQASAQLPGSLIVTITSPTSGSTVSGSTTVSASVSVVGLLVGGVRFTLDGAALGSEDTSAPYAVSWNTTATGNGSHTLRAIARDALGLTYQSQPVTVTVSNAPPSDTTPPAVSITSPASGTTVSGTMNVTANASDNVGVAGVQFMVDGAALGAEDTASPYSASWNTASTSNGSHSLTAVARDAAGNRTTSAAVAVTVSNSTSGGPTRSEETAATLAPAGAWSQITSAGAGVNLSGGQAVYSGTTGATATFTFTGTGVSWIGFQCEQCGTARVHLDGSSVVTIDTYAASRPAASGVLYSTTGLLAGSHTLVIEVTGASNASSSGTFIDVDAFDVEGAPSGGGGGGTAHRIEETDPAVAYVGSWIAQSRSDLSGGTVVESNDPSGTATLTFTGTSVSWIGFKGPWAGIAQVYLDGTLKSTIDTYAPTEEAQAVMYTASGLASGSHTLMVKVTGTWSSSSTSAWIVVDAFDVQ